MNENENENEEQLVQVSIGQAILEGNLSIPNICDSQIQTE